MKIQVISRNVGYALLVSALFMFLSILVSVSRGNDSALAALTISFIITFVVGVFPFIFVRKHSAISTQEGYMIIVLDPSRVFVAMPDVYGGSGWTLEQFANKYDAIGGINAGGFKDDQGSGSGGIPQGLTIVDGHCYNDEFGVTEGFAGFDSNGVLHVGYYTYEDCVKNNIVNAVSFGPVLISNGTPTPPEYLVSGINPRTAIGQRADGAVLMLVIDGRQVHSAGATYQDCVDIMLDYGAINACNMDGGSSTAMYYQGRYVNSISSSNGQCRPLPNAFMFK